MLLVGGVATASVSLAGEELLSVATHRSSFEDVQASCDPSRSGTSIADNGKTLLVDTTGEEDYSGVSYDAQKCILDALKMPTAVQTHIGETRALDGRQQDSWEGFTASWTYHPDDGCDMIIQTD
nr:hypothetical protein GCM10020092_025340 [Actinoplanes digitatis]